MSRSGRVARRAGRALHDAAQQLRDRRILPGTDVPAERIDAVRDWLAEGQQGVELHEAGVEHQAPARVAQTVGAAHELFGPRGRARPQTLSVLSIAGGRLATGAGLAFAPDGRVLAETTWDLEQLRLALPVRYRLPRPVPVAGRHASLISLWDENFFHWMLDAIPRYAVLERAGLAAGAVVVPERLSAFQAESLDLLGISLDRRTPFRRQHIQAGTLLVPSPAGHTGNPLPWAVHWLRDRLGPPAAKRQDRRLYISRAAARSRRVANEDALWQLLKPRGFERVVPEAHRLTEQIRLLSEAAIVVGPHGAAHTNALFANRLTLIELFSADYLNRCNFALAEAAGHDYWYIIGPAERNGAFEAPLEQVEATLDAALG